MRQMTIFDFIPSELETTPLEEAVKRIGEALGLKFSWNNYLEHYEAKIKQYTVDVYYGRYSYKERQGERYIGCGISNRLGGSHGPQDSIEEAIGFLKACMKNRDLLREPKE